MDEGEVLKLPLWKGESRDFMRNNSWDIVHRTRQKS